MARDYEADYKRKLKDALHWMNRAKAAEAKLKQVADIVFEINYRRDMEEAVMDVAGILEKWEKRKS